MEVNNLTFLIYKFAIKNGWIYRKNEDVKFIYLVPDPKLGLPDSFELKLPVSSKTKDFYSYMKNIIDLIISIHAKPNKALDKIVSLNENLKHRYLKNWIIPENKSRINQAEKFDIYIPKKNIMS